MTMELSQNPNNADEWLGNLMLGDGEARFIANDDEELQWGSDEFPTGTAVLDGPSIPITAGNWAVTFNTDDGTFEFLLIQNFASIGIIGDATPGGWDVDTDMNVDPMDASQWNLRIILADGEAKFRADDDWAANWGAGDFPEGIAIRDGANIPITAGEWVIDFNTTTGAYKFTEIIVYDTVGVIGTGTANGDWDNDVFLDKDPDNEFHFSGVVALTLDGEIKFRANADWTVNWGAPEFPAGVGTQDGDNIIITTGGNFLASIFTDTGAYSFSDPSSVEEILDPAYVNIYPNPANQILNVDLSAEEFTGMIHLKVIDMNGRRVFSQFRNHNPTMQIDISNLPVGTYFLQVNSEKHLIGKKFNVVK